MMKTNIAICDDDHTFSHILKSYLSKQLPFEINVTLFHSPFELVEHIQQFDILFLDYDMPYMNGVDFLEKIKDIPIVKIMITHYDHICFHTFQYKLFWFIRKKYFEFDMEQLLPHLQNEIQKEKRKLTIFSNNKYLSIPLQHIQFIDTQANYLIIHTNKENYKVRASFQSILKQFENAPFVVPTHGVMIHLNYIKHIDFHQLTITLINNKVFSISRSKKKGVHEAYVQYIHHI